MGLETEAEDKPVLFNKGDIAALIWAPGVNRPLIEARSGATPHTFIGFCRSQIDYAVRKLKHTIGDEWEATPPKKVTQGALVYLADHVYSILTVMHWRYMNAGRKHQLLWRGQNIISADTFLAARDLITEFQPNFSPETVVFNLESWEVLPEP